MGTRLLEGFRILYGTFFVLVTLWVLIAKTTGLVPGFDPPTRAAADFSEALQQMQFVLPLIMIANVVGGTALMFNRTAPFGIVLLAPPVIGIFFYHLLFTGNFLWGLFWAVGLAGMAAKYRNAFRNLWSYGTRS